MSGPAANQPAGKGGLGAARAIEDGAGDATLVESGLPLASAGPPSAGASGTVGRGSWVVAARLVSQGAQFLTMLAAARVMDLADFGAFALLSALAIGLARVSEAGWREYVMTAEDAEARAQANILALLCGLAALAIGILASGWLYLVAQEPRGAAVTAPMALWVLLTTLSATQAGALVRDGRLAALAITQIAGELAGFAAALAVFAAGGGIFGLVAAKLASQLCVLAACLLATRWFPVAPLRPAKAREAFHFSRRILATRLVAFAQDNASLFAIGFLVGPAGAGLFRAAGRLAGSLLELVAEPLRLLAWSDLRKGDPGRAAGRLLSLALLVSTPLFVGLAVTAEEAVDILLGPGWGESAPLLGAFALAGLLSVAGVITEPLFVVKGRIDLVPPVTLAVSLVKLLALVAAAPFGIGWIAVAQFAATLVTLPVILHLQQRVGGLSLRQLTRGVLPCFLGAGALVAAVLAARAGMPDAWSLPVRFGVLAGLGAAAYLATVALLLPGSAWRRAQPDPLDAAAAPRQS